jgi:hypothetical protein
LKNAHNINDRAEITKLTTEAHIGRNGFKTFWCGFCTREGVKGCVVRLEKKGLDGCDERFDHLGEHFEAGLMIKDYEFQEEDEFRDLGSSDDEDDDNGEEDEEMPDGEPGVVEPLVPPPQDGEKHEQLRATRTSTNHAIWFCVSTNRCPFPALSFSHIPIV